MIASAKSAPESNLTIVGPKTETLFECYEKLPAIASFFEHDGGEPLVLFSGRLTVGGYVPPDELEAFSVFTGAREIEGLEEDVPEIKGFARTLHPIMACRQAPFCEATESQNAAEEGYDILASADADFADGSDRWEWISDMTRRINIGRGKVYTNGASAVIVTAKNCREALIGAVASRPEEQHGGSASALLKSVCAKIRQEGLIPVTVAESEALVGFYARLGFERAGYLALLTLKRGV